MVHHTVFTRRKSQIATDIMMFGTLVDPQHHATAQQSSGCPLQPSAERQSSGRTSPLLTDSDLRRPRLASWGCCMDLHREAKCRTNSHTGHAPSFSFFRHLMWCDVWYVYVTPCTSMSLHPDRWIVGAHDHQHTQMWDKGPSGPSGFPLQIQKLNSF